MPQCRMGQFCPNESLDNPRPKEAADVMARSPKQWVGYPVALRLKSRDHDQSIHRRLAPDIQT